MRWEHEDGTICDTEGCTEAVHRDRTNTGELHGGPIPPVAEPQMRMDLPA